MGETEEARAAKGRSEAARKAIASQTPEQLSENARKAAATRRAKAKARAVSEGAPEPSPSSGGAADSDA